MTTRLVSALALAVAAFLVACGGDDVAQHAQPGPDSEAGIEGTAPSASASVFYRVASDDKEAVVFAVHPDTGEVAPYGPPLPLTGSFTTYFFQLSALADGRQVVSASTSPRSFVLVGDGTSWKVVAEDACRLSALTSPGQTMIRVHHDCESGATLMESEDLVRPDGTSPWKGTSPEQVIGMAPDDSYAVIGESSGLSLLTTATGSKRAIPGTTLDATLATSLVVDDDRTATWLDTQGNPLTVSGFEGDVVSLAIAEPQRFVVINGITPFGETPFQLASGELSALQDRAVAPLQPLPATVQPFDLAAVLPGLWTVVQPSGGTSLSLVGVDGVEVPLYGDAGALAPSTPPLIELEIVTESLVAPRPWLLLEKDVVPTSTASSNTWASTLTLIFPGDPAKAVAPELHDLGTALGIFARTTFATADGHYLVYIDSGHLHCVDVTTRADVAASTSYLFQ